MKRFFGRLLCIAVAVTIVVVISENKTEISEFIDELFHPGMYVDWEEVSSEESQLGSEYKNHFSRLSVDQKKAYNNILCKIDSAQDSFPELIEIPLMTSEELSQVFKAINYDNPEIMCFGQNNKIITDGSRCYFQPSYTLSPKEQKDREAELYEKCSEILDLIPDDADEFEKELFIHDYIINNCRYDTALLEKVSSPYSCLIDGVSACEGYSKAAKLLLEQAGIECHTVLGDGVNAAGETEGHMWNMVKIEGSYYHLDVTWDDPSSPDGGDSLSHLYMNLTDEEISLDHFNFSTPFECTSTKNNYYVRTGRLFNKFNSQVRSDIVRLMGEAENNYLEIRFTDSELYDYAVDYLIDRKNIYYLIRRSNSSYSTDYSTEALEYVENKEKNLLEIYFN